MSGNDYVKFMTEELVRYMDMPQEERERRKEMRKTTRQSTENELFGVLPFAIKFLFRTRRKK
ncbi:hypothetical protein N781_05805 [Pontibacillus halophilus JSM 076056 = DSM 19796]|uniref:YqzE family protein n=1 Tax=Pontibacillus halophilus JSM 076056 = DSM 19796 TaxID=1385510 RepID=A0A0A5GCG5_9BACI|nr:YqzE family protein [Pontibacillus halophilus]KGX90881.1 hypothetical protein N781_05805 [Pontibacillus halophilus JSM 076056 = DSM 19796]